MEDILAGVLVPIAICVVLPVLIVWITIRKSVNSDNKRAEVLLKAIEANNSIDVDRLAEALTKPRRTPRELLNHRLMRGCLFTFIGLALCLMGLLCLNGDPDAEFGDDSVFMPIMFGCCSVAAGISYLIVYAATRRQVEAEEENAGKLKGE